MKLYAYSEEEFNRAVAIVFADFNAISSVLTPTAALLGGQPASGKTKLIRILRQQHDNWVVINGDEYRQYHPRYRLISKEYGPDAPHYTQPFSNTLVEFVKEECLRRKLNFIIEGTMRTYRVIDHTATAARQNGFRVEAHVLAIAEEDSYLGIFQRYEGEKTLYGIGRFSPLVTHNEAYQQIPLNLQQAHQNQLFDSISLYCRNQEDDLHIAKPPILPNEVVGYQVVFKELRQPLRTAPFYLSAWQKIETLALQRGETDSEYLSQIRQFISQFNT